MLSRRYPAMAAFWDRIGGEQVRNMGTVGGNIANGSPIGDTPPPLIALGAELTLRKGDSRRTLPLEDFFIDYGRQDRGPASSSRAFSFRRLPAADRFAVYKVSKRRDEDISALCGAFRVSLDEAGRWSRPPRIAFGGMAATPKRARAVERALVGKPFTEETGAAALGCLRRRLPAAHRLAGDGRVPDAGGEEPSFPLRPRSARREGADPSATNWRRPERWTSATTRSN